MTFDSDALTAFMQQRVQLHLWIGILSEFGISPQLSALENAIFQGLPDNETTDWPSKFSRAVIKSESTDRVVELFVEWLISDVLLARVEGKPERSVLFELRMLWTGEYQIDKADQLVVQAQALSRKASSSAAKAWDELHQLSSSADKNNQAIDLQDELLRKTTNHRVMDAAVHAGLAYVQYHHAQTEPVSADQSIAYSSPHRFSLANEAFSQAIVSMIHDAALATSTVNTQHSGSASTYSLFAAALIAKLTQSGATSF